jgi:hypothetical protein
MRNGRGFSRTAAASIGIMLAMAGCNATVPTQTPSATQSTIPAITRTPTAASTATSTPSPDSSGTPTPIALSSVPMDKTCEDILGLQTLYDYDPNMALVAGRTPTLSPTAADQIRLGGITCVLLNLSSDSETEIIVTKLTATSAAMKTDELATGSNYQVNTEVRGFFTAGAGQFVSDGYWVSVASRQFAGSIDASQISFLIARGL